MKPEEIQALLDLQELDLKLIEYEKHQRELPRLVEEIEGPLERAREAREKAQAELGVARTQHRQVETDLAANNDQFKKLQTQQMGVRNQIEFEAFQHEMETLKDRQDSLEDTASLFGQIRSQPAPLPARAIPGCGRTARRCSSGGSA